MIQKTFDISPALDSKLFFHVVAVDKELRLFELPNAMEIFDADASDLPHECLLPARGATYVLRYNNNNGGPGALHFQVVEARDEAEVRYEVNLQTINGPTVIELQFNFRSNPLLSTP